MFTITLLFAALYASESSGLKLVYFNIRGRAEAIRMILEDQGVPYTNDIVTRCAIGKNPIFVCKMIQVFQNYKTVAP